MEGDWVCNNVTLKAERAQSRGYVTTIIQNFILVSFTSITMPHQVWLPFGASGPFLDLCTWTLLTLRTWSLTVYTIELAGHLCGMFRSGIIYRLSICRGMRLDHSRMSLSSKERPVGWTQPDLLSCAVISLVISIGWCILTRWQRSDTSKVRLDGTSLWRLSEMIGPYVCIHLEQF